MDDDRNLYLRGERWWGDFRPYEDVGGDREPLRPRGATYATKDADEAERLYDERVADLRAAREAAIEPGRHAKLRDFAGRFLKLKAQLSDAKESTMLRLKQALVVGLACLKDEDGRPIDPFLHEHTPADAGQVQVHIKKYVSPKTKKVLSSRSQRYGLDALAELYTYAAFQGHVPEGYNPYKAIPARVKIRNRSFHHLEPAEAGALLQALIEEEGGLTPAVVRHFALAYTGARPEEGSALLGRDILTRTGRVRIDGSKRTGPSDQDAVRYVPLAPQFQLIVTAYRQQHPGRGLEQLLTFTHARKSRTGEEVPIRDSRKLLQSAVEQAADAMDAAGIAHQLREKRIVPRSWRPTYCTLRLQALEDGEPVAPHAVMLEMGHRSLVMINRIYNRLGKSRPERRPFVEYRRTDGRFPGEDQVREILGDERVDAVLRNAEAKALASDPVDGDPPIRLMK